MFKYSLESLTKIQEDVIKDIRFPPSEIESLKPRTTIVTHRVSDDANKFDRGDYVYCEEVEENYCFEVVDKVIINHIEDSKYYDKLTQSQKTYLSKFDCIAVLTLKKTKYERPYKLSTIKAKYPPKLYKKLVANPCHHWRAETGIDMIHLEPDDAEQKRTCGNWRLMPDRYKRVSDQKSVEIFGCDNLSHEKMLTIDRLRSIFRSIHYGWRNPKTDKPFKTKAEFKGLEPEDVWRLGTPEQTIKAECGNCYDTVAISFEMLKKSPIKFKVFFMSCEGVTFNGAHWSEGPTHTVCIYQNEYDHKWYWLEGSWGPFRNNDWSSPSPEALISWIAKAMANDSESNIEVRELKAYPKYGCDMTAFEAFCRNFKVVTVAQFTGPKNYFRYTTINDQGIYQAVKEAIFGSKSTKEAKIVWQKFLSDPAVTWLKRPDGYPEGVRSWFTEAGKDKFENLTLPKILEYIPKTNVKVLTTKSPGEIVYRDRYQVFVK